MMMHLGVIYLLWNSDCLKLPFRLNSEPPPFGLYASHRATNAGFCIHSHKKHQICPTLSASTSDVFAKVKVLGCERSLARKPSCRKSHTVGRDRWTDRDKCTHPLTPPWRAAGATALRHSAIELLHEANAPVSITCMYNLWGCICLHLAKNANDERPLLSCSEKCLPPYRAAISRARLWGGDPSCVVMACLTTSMQSRTPVWRPEGGTIKSHLNRETVTDLTKENCGGGRE